PTLCDLSTPSCHYSLFFFFFCLTSSAASDVYKRQGLVLGVLVGLSGGAIGPGRLTDAGPPLLTPLLVAVPVMALGGALGAVLSHYRGARANRPPDTSSRGRPRLWKRHEPAGADRRVGGS
ncbi:hypothetical protein AERO_17470, partial [Aeromicrobium fastidiosum]|nr:hypothetical protein [Aeromicrobium fastidiosum]